LTSEFSPGLSVMTLTNRPPVVEFTRAFESFHADLTPHAPRSAARLIALARDIVRGGCR
jgi:hypothetical protein